MLRARKLKGRTMSLTGSKITLGPLLADDVTPMFRWFNDVEAARLDLAYRPVDWPTHKAWFDGIGKDPTRVLFAIRRLGNPALVGFVALSNLHPVHRSAEMGLRIGEERDRGQGLGTEALQLGLEFCWQHLNLQRVWLQVFRHNERAIRAYRKAGFHREGVLRRAAFVDGRWADLIPMAALRHAPGGKTTV
jgi:diamine N-acetyltransferase